MAYRTDKDEDFLGFFGLLLMCLAWAVLASGCAAYYDSIRDSNEAMYKYRRDVKVSLQSADGGPIGNLGKVNIEVPLDAHKTPVVPESFGKQVMDVIKAATPIGLVGIVADKLGNSNNSTVEKSKETYIEKTSDVSSTVVTGQ